MKFWSEKKGGRSWSVKKDGRKDGSVKNRTEGVKLWLGKESVKHEMASVVYILAGIFIFPTEKLCAARMFYLSYRETLCSKRNYVRVLQIGRLHIHPQPHHL